jgi:CheY-like chemotaxis protein
MKKILIVDDEEEVLKLLSERLRQKNYYVTAVSRGEDAIARCRMDKPDLILLDIAMPDMDGYTIASALREDKLFRDIPIIFVTGKELEHKGIQERIEQLGVYDYIMKPCSFQELLTKIQGFIG